MESEPCVPLRLFGAGTLTDDEDYRLYMQAARDDMSAHCDAKCEEYAYNFFEDCALKAMERARFEWEQDEKEWTKGGAGPIFEFEGRASMASIGNFSTMPSLGPELASDEIPEISFSRLGRTSLTNEDFVNYPQEEIEEGDAALEDDEEPPTRIPYQGDEQSPGSLLNRGK